MGKVNLGIFLCLVCVIGNAQNLDCEFKVEPKLEGQTRQSIDERLLRFDDCIQEQEVEPKTVKSNKPTKTSKSTKSVGIAEVLAETVLDEAVKTQPALRIIKNTKSKVDTVRRQSGSAVETRENSSESEVATLLREAAEKETDPERKASLYKSYAEYLAEEKKSK